MGKRELEKQDDISSLRSFSTKLCFLLNYANGKIFMSIHPHPDKIR